MKENEVGHTRDKKNAYTVLVRKPEVTGQLGRTRYR
jgi:hypothetical protein